MGFPSGIHGAGVVVDDVTHLLKLLPYLILLHAELAIPVEVRLGAQFSFGDAPSAEHRVGYRRGVRHDCATPFVVYELLPVSRKRSKDLLAVLRKAAVQLRAVQLARVRGLVEAVERGTVIDLVSVPVDWPMLVNDSLQGRLVEEIVRLKLIIRIRGF